jgi:hypothetical protein
MMQPRKSGYAISTPVRHEAKEIVQKEVVVYKSSTRFNVIHEQRLAPNGRRGGIGADLESVVANRCQPVNPIEQ